MLTNEEKQLLSLIALDNETGNHLLGRKRPDGYWELRDGLYSKKTQMPREKREMMMEYVRQCSDYDYYNSLPLGERLF